MRLFLTLLFYHGLADYPLQGDFLAKAKNYRMPIPGVNWQITLFWHAVISGGFVTLATGSYALGVLETILHFIVDYSKCAGKINFWQDQALHVACRIGYVMAVMA